MRQRRFDPAPGIDIIKQQLDWITSGNGNLHRLSSSSISAVEQLADCSNPSTLAFRFHRQACQLDNNRRTVLGWRANSCTSAKTLGRPPGLPLWPLRNFIGSPCKRPVLRQIRTCSLGSEKIESSSNLVLQADPANRRFARSTVLITGTLNITEDATLSATGLLGHSIQRPVNEKLTVSHADTSRNWRRSGKH